MIYIRSEHIDSDWCVLQCLNTERKADYIQKVAS